MRFSYRGVSCLVVVSCRVVSCLVVGYLQGGGEKNRRKSQDLRLRMRNQPKGG